MQIKGLVSLTLAVAAAILGYRGSDAWGWFLFAAVVVFAHEDGKAVFSVTFREK